MTPAAQTLVNGLPIDQVAALDRGLSYGDGVFRTLRIRHGQPVWWADHLEKLQADCQRLQIPVPTPEVWQQDCDSLVLPEYGVMRMTVTRGLSPRGYAMPDTPSVTRIVSVWADDAAATAEPVNIDARVCQLRLGHQPALAGVKHLNRLENVLARSEWRDPSIREGLLLDEHDFVISGVMTNVFIWRDQILQTPLLDQCGVAGVTRARLMRHARQVGLRVEERRLTLNDVLAADELMFTNSLIGLWRVKQVGDRQWPTPQISKDLWTMLHA